MTMTRAEALEASIQHWKDNLAAETPKKVEVGPKDCALCGLFFYDSCHGCPVNEKTRRTGCRGSPYEQADDAHSEWLDYPDDMCLRDAWRAAARAMIEFLESLREDAPHDRAAIAKAKGETP